MATVCRSGLAHSRCNSALESDHQRQEPGDLRDHWRRRPGSREDEIEVRGRRLL